MTTVGFCPSVREAWERATELCFRLFPCLSDPARRSAWGQKAALLLMHLVIVGVLFLFDRDLIQKIRKEPWWPTFMFIYVNLQVYFNIFGALCCHLVSVFLHFKFISRYVVDAMKAWNEAHATFTQTPRTSKQTASSKDGSLVCPMVVPQLERSISGMNSSPWVKQVMNLYPLGSSRRNWTCCYCNVIQPPRTKHCHDCDKCVLQFDHHCVWLGQCIGQGNHCRFWWYIFEESILSIWTSILYISFLKGNTTRQWWMDAVAIILLAILLIALIFLLLLLHFHSYLILTNQTTYELVRRRRISYLRGIPDRIYPFSKGICRNLYDFCCSRTSIYSLERLPTTEELEAKAKPYTCVDVISCRCC